MILEGTETETEVHNGIPTIHFGAETVCDCRLKKKDFPLSFLRILNAMQDGRKA